MKRVKKITKPGTLQALAYERIKGLFINGIISGDLNAEGIYSARHFAEILGVSRTPVREALLQLTAEGLLVAARGLGFKLKRFSKREIQEWFELRRLMEIYLVECFVDNLKESDLEPLESTLNRMRKTAKDGDTHTYLKADEMFHMLIASKKENHLFESVLRQNRNRITIFCHRALSEPGRIEQTIHEHDNILQALRRRDKQLAKKQMLNHLNITEEYLINNLNL